MWLFGQMQPNIGDSRRFVQASWHASLLEKEKKKKLLRIETKIRENLSLDNFA